MYTLYRAIVEKSVVRNLYSVSGGFLESILATLRKVLFQFFTMSVSLLAISPHIARHDMLCRSENF
jgi:hypothetical protein